MRRCVPFLWHELAVPQGSRSGLAMASWMRAAFARCGSTFSSDKLAEPRCIGRRRTFLIVIKVDEHLTLLLSPTSNALWPCAQGGLRIVVSVATVGSVTSHVNVSGCRDPWCWRQMVIREAQRYVVRAQQAEDRLFVPRWMAELEGIPAPPRQRVDEAC